MGLEPYLDWVAFVDKQPDKGILFIYSGVIKKYGIGYIDAKGKVRGCDNSYLSEGVAHWAYIPDCPNTFTPVFVSEGTPQL